MVACWLKPCGVFVGGVIIPQTMQIPVRRCLLAYEPQEAQPFVSVRRMHVGWVTACMDSRTAVRSAGSAHAVGEGRRAAGHWSGASAQPVNRPHRCRLRFVFFRISILSYLDSCNPPASSLPFKGDFHLEPIREVELLRVRSNRFSLVSSAEKGLGRHHRHDLASDFRR